MPQDQTQESTEKNSTNQRKVASMQITLEEIYAQVFRKEYYGSVSLRFTIQDGIIQGISCNLERSIR
ncbi:MAG: hypothetical protein Q4D38_08090 [Planctomycetia bacterium]|nr:hypothetical protein [Planctomycetia bacterium]